MKLTATAAAMNNDQLSRLAYNAHANISFRPEQRAALYVSSLRSKQSEIRAMVEAFGRQHGTDPALVAKVADEECLRIERLWTAWMGAKSRCISSMITGPANFPVRRAEKANRTEEKRGREYYDATGYVVVKF